MATELTFGAVPPFYREVYDVVCPDAAESHITRDIFVKLFVKSSLSTQTLSLIWDCVENRQGCLTRSGLYKALALVAFAQQGKRVNEKLLENFSGEELPKPVLGDLSDLKALSQKLQRNRDPTILGLTYSDICAINAVNVRLVPEKKGLILKHVEYQVVSERFQSQVSRRYNDFVALSELLIGRYPYRLISKLPPKKIVGADSHFIEERRKGLERWLTLVVRHPVIGDDSLVEFFLTFPGPQMHSKIREHFRHVPDEFFTSGLGSKAKELVPEDSHTQFASSKEHVSVLWSSVAKLKQIADNMVQRSAGYAFDMLELGNQLTCLSSYPHPVSTWATGESRVWSEMKKGFHVISKEFNLLSEKAQSRREEIEIGDKLALLLDVLGAYKELCERMEKGLLQDHQRALSKVQSIKKRQIQTKMPGFLSGLQSESINELESRILEQESVMSDIENRHSFSMHCIHLETQLVHVYLEILVDVLNTLVIVHNRGHSEMAKVWEQIQPTLEKCLPDVFYKPRANGC